MFSSDDEQIGGIPTGGFRKISIIGKNPMISLWFIGTFCTSFISYQLETWQMLADTNHQMQSEPSIQTNSNQSERKLHNNQEEDEKSYNIWRLNNSIYSQPQRGSRDLTNTKMRTGFSIDEKLMTTNMATANTTLLAQNQPIQVANNWRGLEYPIISGNEHEQHLLNHKAPSQHLNHSSIARDKNFINHRNHQFIEHSRTLINQQCENSRLFTQQVQGQEFANIRSHTSMDNYDNSEYLIRWQPPIQASDSYQAQISQVNQQKQHLMCHRRRNASCSSSTRVSNTFKQQDLYKRPSTGISASNMVTTNQPVRPTLHSNCPPQSSGSLPASLQLCNWKQSHSDSFEFSLEAEPVSLPSMKSDKKLLHNNFISQSQHPSINRAAQNQHHNFNIGLKQCNWQNNPILEQHMNQRRYNNTVLNRQIFKQSNDSTHPLQVGSDSELYSRNQKARKSQQNHTNTSDWPQPLDYRAHKVDQTANKAMSVYRNTSDNYRTVRAPIKTQLSLSTSIQTTTTQMSQPMSDHSIALKKGNNSNKLSLAGAKRRLGFKQKGLVSLSVQRSEEVVPKDANLNFLSQLTSSSLADSATDSVSNINNWQSQQQIPPESIDPRINFVEGLGAGQIASRQALVSPYLGDIQLTLSDRRGMLEVEVVRARRLQLKAGAKTLPSPYVKLYLMKNKKCLAKSKTLPVRQTLDPLYQQQFIFREDYTNCILQVIVWGDYGKKDRKSLMGIVQIKIDDLDISNLVIDWYRMFNAPSMANSLLSSRALRQMILTKTLENDQRNNII